VTVVCRRYELVSAVQLMMPGRGGSFILHETLIVILQKVIELHKMQLKIDLFLVFLFVFVNGKKETFLSFFLSFFLFFLSFFLSPFRYLLCQEWQCDQLHQGLT
jgi:hypothetical protein